MTTLPLGDFLASETDAFVESPFDSRNPLELIIPPPEPGPVTPIILFLDWVDLAKISRTSQTPFFQDITHPYVESSGLFLQDYQSLLQALTLSRGFDWSTRNKVRPNWLLTLVLMAGRTSNVVVSPDVEGSTILDGGVTPTDILPPGVRLLNLGMRSLLPSGNVVAVYRDDFTNHSRTRTYATWDSATLDTTIAPDTVANIGVGTRLNYEVNVSATLVGAIPGSATGWYVASPNTRSSQLVNDIVEYVGVEPGVELTFLAPRALARWQGERSGRWNITTRSFLSVPPFHNGATRFLLHFATVIRESMGI